MKRILFVMLHPGFIRYYEDALLALAAAGHHVHLAFEISSAKLGSDVAAWRLVSKAPDRLSCDVAPTRDESVRTFLARTDRSATRTGAATPSIVTPAGRAEAWESLATTVRLMQDALRFYEPAFARAVALQARVEKRLPRVHRRLLRVAHAGGRPGRAVASAFLRAIERTIPSPAPVDAFVRRHQPDLLLVTPLVELGSQQVDYIKCARRLGIRSALCVASWDNLTSKGLVRVPPHHVVVWNEAQKREAVELHGIDPRQVVITGAQLFDRWFDAEPSRSREEFCRAVGLDPSRPYVLYVGSSTFIAPDERPFVERWLTALRRSGKADVAAAGVLIRPHPANADQWRVFDAAVWENVVVWPAPGTDPVRPDAPRDYFDSLYHSGAVIGINTSAQIEAGIVGRAVLTIRDRDFAHAQDGTLHFRHLVGENGGLVRAADTLGEHVEQLAAVLSCPDEAREANRAFLESFVRPFGVDAPAVPVFTREIERLAELPAPAVERETTSVRLARGPLLLVAALARTLADDRPLWVYGLRPFVTIGVWTVAAGYGLQSAWHEQGYPAAKRARRALSRASYEGGKRVSRSFRRARKPIEAAVRGAARRLAGRNA